MLKQIIEGKDGISHPEFDRYLGRPHKVDDVHDTFVERFQDINNQQRHRVKGMMKRKVIGTMGTTQLEIKFVVQGKMIG